FFFGWNVYCATHDLLGAYPFSLRLTAYSTDESEAFVLAPSRKNLIDAKGQIDFSAVSHLTNFWKYHTAINDERDMHNLLLQLPSSQYPKTLLEQPMRKKRRLGMRWKGALTVLYNDAFFTGGNRLLDLAFKHVSGNSPWPKAFEQEIGARPLGLSNDEQFINPPVQSPPISETAKSPSSRHSTKIATTPNTNTETHHSATPQRSIADAAARENRSKGETSSPTAKAGKAEEKHFFGLGEVDINIPPLNIAGIVHSLPPQCGIPGWQRFTMVSYETPPSGSEQKGYLDAKEADLHPYLRYEGVVLPGESIIIGRYSLGDEYRDDDDPEQFQQRGTFIYWLAPDDDDENDEAEHDDGNAEAESG
ncbi:MAG: hypothetical protein L6R42_011326, partial [Xanthoria sp. 1 TBL-2021]